jgi:hypothetical protein
VRAACNGCVDFVDNLAKYDLLQQRLWKQAGILANLQTNVLQSSTQITMTVPG